MIKAMESGTGSISTTHAADAEAAVRKLVTCAMEAGPHVTHELATSKLAETIDLIVQLDWSTSSRQGGGSERTRWVAEIIAVAPGEQEPGYATTHVFRADAAGVAAPDVLPDEYRQLARYGFDLAALPREPTAGGGHDRLDRATRRRTPRPRDPRRRHRAAPGSRRPAGSPRRRVGCRAPAAHPDRCSRRWPLGVVGWSSPAG